MSENYQQFAALLAIAAIIGVIAVRLRQPLIIAFLMTGILVGPAALGWVESHDQIDLLAQVGVTVLLFVVGLKLDLHLVKNLGPVALATGLGQLAFTIVFGYLIAIAFGMTHVKALYVAVALTFSSTIIIVKLLSDKREIDSLHGRIAMGFLIVQDIAVVIAMMLLGSHAASGEHGLLLNAALLVLKIGGAGAVIALLMRYVLPRLLHQLARSQELLLIFAIAWGTAFAALGEVLGFSKEVGAFLAGFSLASTTYREAISTRLVSIRDFLLLFFFVDMGSRLDFSTLGQELPAAGAFSLFVLIGNPLIVMAIMGYMGYRKRTGFLAGLTVAQISEFSIIFVAMGITLGHVGVETLGLVTLVGLVTITLSTYLILYSHQLYGRIARWLDVFERANPFRELAMERRQAASDAADVVIYGLGRYGARLASQLQAQDVRVLGVDFDPEAVRQRRRQGFKVNFGDAEDPEFPQALPLGRLRWIVSTLPQAEINLALLKALRHHGYGGRVAMAAHSDSDSRALAAAGVDRVLSPYSDAADFAARTIAGDLATMKRQP
ncbi:MAG: cation:proton antiporter [Burkholderiales bacterium]|nr:cation:proton antiporter [Burkholderiales bacterium]